MGATALIARRVFSNGVQGALPSDQWHQEVEHWHATLKANTQRYLVELATGPSDLAMEKHVQGPSDKQSQHMCQNQVRQLSFSVLTAAGHTFWGPVVKLALLGRWADDMQKVKSASHVSFSVSWPLSHNHCRWRDNSPTAYYRVTPLLSSKTSKFRIISPP